MVPITWERHWVLMILNFEKRKVCWCASAKALLKSQWISLIELALVLVEVSIKEGVRSELGIWHEEENLIKTWEWSKTTCVTSRGQISVSSI
jgi:hypothetical protein